MICKENNDYRIGKVSRYPEIMIMVLINVCWGTNDDCIGKR